MKLLFLSGLVACCVLLSGPVLAQRLKSADVPAVVKEALQNKYPAASGVTWEKEKGNFEANWGGKSGEDNSVTYTPQGNFVEIVVAMPVSQLPAAITAYVKANYGGAKITEAGKVTDAAGKIRYEAEVSGKDLLFDENGNIFKKD